MRCISLRQPYAYLILHSDKDVENRRRRTHHRGPLAIHASLTVNYEACRKYGLDPEKLPTGKVLGTVEVYDCIRNSKSKWAQRGRYHWLLRNPKRLRKYIPACGNSFIFWVGL